MSPASHFLLVDPAGLDMYGLKYSDKHLVFKWVGGDIYFSMTQVGGAAECHFAAAKKDLRSVKHIIELFVGFVFWLFPWCKMVITLLPSSKKSIERVIKKLGFVQFCEYEGGIGYMRRKDG